VAQVVKWTGGFALAVLTVIFIFAFSYIAWEFLWEMPGFPGSGIRNKGDSEPPAPFFPAKTNCVPGMGIKTSGSNSRAGGMEWNGRASWWLPSLVGGYPFLFYFILTPSPGAANRKRVFSDLLVVLTVARFIEIALMFRSTDR